MNHDDIRLNVPLAASGSLSPQDEREVMSHIQGCTECHTAFREYQELFHAMLPEPSEEDWAGFDALREDFSKRLVSDRGEAHSKPQRRMRMRTVGWAAAVLLLVGTGGVTWRLEQTHSPAATFMAEASTIIQLTGKNSDHRATLYVKGRRVLFMPHRLPPLPPHSVYEGWWIVHSKPIPAGTFHDNPTFLAWPDHHPAQFAVTIEPNGGTKVPTTAIIIAGNLPAQKA